MNETLKTKYPVNIKTGYFQCIEAHIYSSKVPCLGWALLNPAVSGYGRLPQQVKQKGIYLQEIFGKVVRWLSQVKSNVVP